MPHVLKSSSLAFLTITLLLVAHCTIAQPAAASLPKSLTPVATITNNSLLLTWHVFAKGKWGIAEQKPAFKSSWKLVDAGLYHTNADTASVTLPLPEQTTLYRLMPAFAFQQIPPPPPPPLPSPNSAKPGKLPKPLPPPNPNR